MSFGQYIVIPIAIALQAVTMMILTPYIPLNGMSETGYGLVTWISFQAWAVYFLAGCTPKMGVKALIGYGGGIVASIAIFELGGLLSGLNGDVHSWGLYMAVFLVVIVVISMEKVPWFDFVPAYFVGAGVFFALRGQGPEVVDFAWYGKIAVTEMLACAIGLVYGAITVTCRVWYEGKFAEKTEEGTEAAEVAEATS